MIPTLQQLGLNAVFEQYDVHRPNIHVLTNNVLFALYCKFIENERYGMPAEDVGYNMVSRFLQNETYWPELLKYHQILESKGHKVFEKYFSEYSAFLTAQVEIKNEAECALLLKRGILFGSFLCDGGWYKESIDVLEKTGSFLPLLLEPSLIRETMLLELNHRLLNIHTTLYDFLKAEEAVMSALGFNDKIISDYGGKYNCAVLYASIANFYITKCDYSVVTNYMKESINQIDKTVPKAGLITILSVSSKFFLFKRDWGAARGVLHEAINRARELYGMNHPRFGNLLRQYAFTQLSQDSVLQSVVTYTKALEILEQTFGCGNNLTLALTEEELAYATYITEYNSGSFDDSNDHCQRAVVMMEKLLPNNHPLLLSAKRVKALILEEQAVDMYNLDNMYGIPPRFARDKLENAEKWQLAVLEATREIFGEENLALAKQYGNMGRIHQSMRKYELSEIEHKKAIRMKKEILGPDDFEVGLSFGHLASVYNYHLGKTDEAEQLYLRSIQISTKLFGNTYSGLQYDYSGLEAIYTRKGNEEMRAFYNGELRKWKVARRELARNVLSFAEDAASFERDIRTRDELRDYLNEALDAVI